MGQACVGELQLQPVRAPRLAERGVDDAVIALRKSYSMSFYGAMDEYPTGFSPNSSWSSLYNALKAAGVGQSSLSVSTDI